MVPVGEEVPIVGNVVKVIRIQNLLNSHCAQNEAREERTVLYTEIVIAIQHKRTTRNECNHFREFSFEVSNRILFTVTV